MNFVNAIKIIRPKQWLKNTLIFIPNIAANSLTFDNFNNLCIVFVSFSLIVSSTFVALTFLSLFTSASSLASAVLGDTFVVLEAASPLFFFLPSLFPLLSYVPC